MASCFPITTVMARYPPPVSPTSLRSLASVPTCGTGAGGWADCTGNVEEQAVVNGRMTAMRCRW